ncbi:MAG: hypothetical protein MMC33_009505 [Icmadophila ericetorum]|nr:hypothetical protein [Icmadophila ericetorum]
MLVLLEYGYPLLPYVQWAKPLLSKALNNSVYSETGLISPDDKSVVRPNVDTLYSEVAVDLSHTDLELIIPSIPNGRFYVFPFYDLYGNNFANLGSITNSPNGTYLGFIDFPTTYGAILIRFVLYNNDSDVEVIKAIQEQIQMSPIDRPDTSDPAAPWLSSSFLDSGLSDDAALTWPGSFSNTATTQLLNLTARLYPYAPPDNTSDTTRVTTYLTAAGLNLSAGIYSPPPNVNFTASNLIIDARLNAQLDSPTSYVNLSGSSWLATATSLSGDFQSDYVTRANVAWAGYLQLLASVAIYPEYYGLGGSAGANILNATNESALLFSFSGKPPVDGF